MPLLSSPAEIRELLSRARTVAVVGISDNPARDSHGVASYLKARGYRLIAVNPSHQEVLDQPCYQSLSDIPGEERRRIDLVDVFRKPEAALEVAREAVRLGLKAIWFQLGVATPEAIEEADRAGLQVVAESCIKTAHHLLRP
jgi:predicted CoA-binding protein